MHKNQFTSQKYFKDKFRFSCHSVSLCPSHSMGHPPATITWVCPQDTAPSELYRLLHGVSPSKDASPAAYLQKCGSGSMVGSCVSSSYLLLLFLSKIRLGRGTVCSPSWQIWWAMVVSHVAFRADWHHSWVPTQVTLQSPTTQTLQFMPKYSSLSDKNLKH